MWNEPYGHQDPYTITETTRVLNLTRRYRPGMGDLVIYVNGMIARLNTDYIELNSYTLQFLDDLVENDVVVCQYQRL